MSAYSQVKRQKVREVRPGENVDYFQGIDKVEYNNMAAAGDVTAFRHYSGSERVHARAMDDWLKMSLCLADFRANGSDSATRSPHRPWDDGSDTLDNRKRCVKALFDCCTRLGIKHWSAFDTDLVPGDWEEARQHWDEMIEYVQELAQRNHMRLLWLAPDLHSHTRYASGFNEASTFCAAAAQTKRCVDAAQRLNAECVSLRPRCRRAMFHADEAREHKLWAKLMKLTAEYRDRLNYRCQLLLQPQWREPERYSAYDCDHGWDVPSWLLLLRHHGLERQYRVVAPPGHQLLHASVYNMLGGAVIRDDCDHYNIRRLTLMMKCIIDQGPLPGGTALRLRARREADARAVVARRVLCADALARALRLAAGLAADHGFTKHLQQRYGTFYSGFGSRLVNSDVTMEECEDYYKKNQSQSSEPASQELTELMLQRHLDSADHI